MRTLSSFLIHLGYSYVNYGNGDGTFVSAVKDLYYPHCSVAVADLNGDGLDDLVTSYYGGSFLVVFINDGSGGFAYSAYIPDGNLLSSPIDTYDLDGDGNQDLVIGGYRNGNLYTGIAVMQGQGGGNFDSAVAYGGASHRFKLD